MSDLIQAAQATAIASIQAGMASGAAGAALGALLPAAASVALGASDAMPVKDEAVLSIVLNDVSLPATSLDAVAEVIVKQDVEAPSTFSLRLTGDDALALADQSTYNLGGTLTVSLGYTSSEAIIQGEITGLEIDLPGDGAPSLIVRGYDLRHRLRRGTRTDAYAKAADSAIAARIAKRNGLEFVGKATKPIYDLVIQHEQTDFDFLKERAARIGYEVVVDDKNLDFRPRPLGASPKVTLSMSGDVIDFYARMSDASMPSQLRVRGWDATQKQPIDEGASATDLTGMGGTVGATVASSAFSLPTLDGKVSQVDQPVFNTEEAKAMAVGQLQDAVLGFMTGEGTALGNPGIRAGTTLGLTNLGNRFGGTYYVLSAEHTYTREQGYRTKFTVRRNATQTKAVAVSLPANPGAAGS